MDTAATPASPEAPQVVACRVWDLTSAKLTIKVVLKTYARGADGTMGALSGSRRATRGGLFLDIFPISFVRAVATGCRGVEPGHARIWIATFIARSGWVSPSRYMCLRQLTRRPERSVGVVSV